MRTYVRSLTLVMLVVVIGLAELPASTAQAPPQRITPLRIYSSLFFWSPTTGWIVSIYDLVLTRDGGQSWTVLLSRYGRDPRLKTIGHVYTRDAGLWWFEDDNLAWVTSNGGQNWTTWPLLLRRPDGTPEATVGQVVLVSPTEAWGIETSSGEALCHTFDSGRTWTRVQLPTSGLTRVNLQRLVFPSTSVGWVALTSGYIFRTTDGGTTWERRGQTPRPLLQLKPLNAQVAWALDLRGVQVYRTTDGGATWQISLPSLPEGAVLAGLFALDSNTAWAVGIDGVIVATTDGGQTWRLQESGTPQTLLAIHFTDPQHGWAVGEVNTILKTTDGGQTWIKVDDDLKNWHP
jgi:photosystem II stability/assembly factor-like uncharacterized protein